MRNRNSSHYQQRQRTLRWRKNSVGYVGKKVWRLFGILRRLSLFLNLGEPVPDSVSSVALEGSTEFAEDI